jgi:predicted dinucleotide-binding enzyme
MREPNPGKVLDDPSAVKGKIVMELNNRDYSEVKDGRWFDKSFVEQLHEHAPGCQNVGVFNTIPMEGFDRDATELLAAGGATFLAGGSPEAREKVGRIALTLGFRPFDFGEGPAALRAVEALGDAIRMILIDGNEDGVAHLTISKVPVRTLGSVGQRADSNYG